MNERIAYPFQTITNKNSDSEPVFGASHEANTADTSLEALRLLRDTAEETKRQLDARRMLGIGDEKYQELDRLNDESWEAYEKALCATVGQNALYFSGDYTQ